MLKDFPIGILTAERLIEIIEIAQNEGYGHSADIYYLRDELKKFIESEK